MCHFLRHGGRIGLWLLVGSSNVSGNEPDEWTRVQTRVFPIEYQVNPEAEPLQSIQLWYTLDQGATWQQYGFDDDRQSPFPFHSPSEGPYGFFLVAANESGPSSQPPTEKSKAHRWVFVDYTPPVVQLHPPQIANVGGQSVVQLRWTAVDSNLTPRPVRVDYQRLPDRAWIPAGKEPIANTGRLDWATPAGMSGAVAFRISVTDSGDNTTHSVPQIVDLPAITPVDPATDSFEGLKSPRNEALASKSADSNKREDQAARFMDEALRLRDSGKYREAVARLRESVRISPRQTDAFTEMGAILYRIGDWNGALSAYDMALKQQPNLRSALQGSAMVLRQKGDHSGAGERLRTILRHHPRDAEVWMNLGDVAVFQGNDVMARECYTHASTIDSSAKQVIAEAQKRLSLMNEMPRTRQSGSSGK